MPDSGHGQPLGRGVHREKQKVDLSSGFLASSKGIPQNYHFGVPASLEILSLPRVLHLHPPIPVPI